MHELLCLVYITQRRLRPDLRRTCPFTSTARISRTYTGLSTCEDCVTASAHAFGLFPDIAVRSQCRHR